jgi:competence ComEA-like helix-hairpin-helix protein
VVERSTVGVLGIITAALALAALAAQPRSTEPALAAPLSPRSTAAPSAPSLRALRDGARIDINRASPADFELLPGVGPTLARRIVAHRAANGPFRAPEELLNVHGIGRRTLDRLLPLLTFDEAAAAAGDGGQLSNIQTTEAVIAK